MRVGAAMITPGMLLRPTIIRGWRSGRLAKELGPVLRKRAALYRLDRKVAIGSTIDLETFDEGLGDGAPGTGTQSSRFIRGSL